MIQVKFSMTKDNCIETGEVRTLCKELKLPFVECSAKENTNVQEVYKCIISINNMNCSGVRDRPETAYDTAKAE